MESKIKLLSVYIEIIGILSSLIYGMILLNRYNCDVSIIPRIIIIVGCGIFCSYISSILLLRFSKLIKTNKKIVALLEKNNS